MELRHVWGQNVVGLFAGRPVVSFPAIAQVDAYWEGLRAGRLMPTRAEVDPRGLEGALEYAFILEYIGRGVGRLRIAGMHLNDLLGMEVRGMPLTSFFAPDAREKVAATLESVVTRPQVADLTVGAARGIGRPALTGRMFLAPLGTDGNGAPRILGCLQTQGTLGRAPRRFDVEHVQTRRIVATAQTPQPVADGPVVQHGFAESAAPFGQSNPYSRPQRPSLRLIKNEE
jgi:hypothetical protein